MSARDIVGGLAEAAVSAAKNPLKTTAQAVGMAKGAVSTGAAAAEGLAQHAADRMRKRHAAPVKQSEPASNAEPQADPGKPEPADAKAKPAPKKTTKKKAPAKDQSVDEGPQLVLREPGPPAEPPIDVVGEALAAEAEEEQYGGRAGEPRGASRDEEHGDASLQRAEVDEIADEAAEGLPGGDVDVETPVGTTGAGVGYNPDTAEADLQQPDTQPLVDPALTKEVKTAERRGKRDSTKNPKS